MATIYTTNSISYNHEVRLCKSSHPNYAFAIMVSGRLKAYADTFADAYRLYNEYAR